MAHTERIVLLCPDDLIAKLDQYRRAQSDIPSRAEAMRRLARAAMDHSAERYPAGAAS